MSAPANANSNQNGPHRCNDPRCRARLAGAYRGMFAANRRAESAEMARGIRNAAQGGDARRTETAPPNQATQYFRLETLHERIKNSASEDNVNRHKAVECLYEGLLADAPEPESDRAKQYEALASMLSESKQARDELNCVICLSPVTPETMFCGIGCFHLTCSDCVLADARTNAREMGDMTIAVYDAWGNPQFEADGSRKFNPDKLGQYPSVGYRQCPLRCPGPYCTKAHYEINEAARKDVLEGTFVDQEEETPECALETARAKTQVLLLPVEGRDDLCMLVEAKVPFTKRGMPTGYINNHDKTFKGLFPITHKIKSMGFSWDHDKSVTGGKCWFAQRALIVCESMPQFDELPDGAQLVHSKATANSNGGTWKVDLPVALLVAEEQERERLKRAREAEAAAAADDESDEPLSQRPRTLPASPASDAPTHA